MTPHGARPQPADAGPLPFLSGYPAALQAQVRALLDRGELAPYLAQRYPQAHAIRSSALLYEHVQALKQRHLRRAPPLGKVGYDSRLILDQRALGTLSTVSRVQGARLQTKREIRIAAVFKDAPAAMLDMIVVHELAHLKEREHDKAFYALCASMLPDYAQIEFDTRLHLLLRQQQAAVDRRSAQAAQTQGAAEPGATGGAGAAAGVDAVSDSAAAGAGAPTPGAASSGRAGGGSGGAP